MDIEVGFFTVYQKIFVDHHFFKKAFIEFCTTSLLASKVQTIDDYIRNEEGQV